MLAWSPRKQSLRQSFLCTYLLRNILGSTYKEVGGRGAKQARSYYRIGYCQVQPGAGSKTTCRTIWRPSMVWTIITVLFADFRFPISLIPSIFSHWNSSVKNCPFSSLFTPIETHRSFPYGLQPLIWLFVTQIISDGHGELSQIGCCVCRSIFYFYYKSNICLGRGYMGLLCIFFSTSYNSIIISKKKKKIF